MMRNGFTLIEIMLVIMIMVVIAAMTLPSALDQDGAAADAAARLLESDLEHAQLLALSRPDQRIGLAVDADGYGWRIVDADAPQVALHDAVDSTASTRELAVRCGEGRARVASEAQIDPAGEIIVFDPLGGLEIPSGTDRTLGIQRGGAMRVVSVNPETGFISLQIP